jgi:hypothetical protein
MRLVNLIGLNLSECMSGAVQAKSGKIKKLGCKHLNHHIGQRNNFTMTRSDLIMYLTEQYPQLLAKDADLAVKVILDSMSATQSQGGRIEIRGFGSFFV